MFIGELKLNVVSKTFKIAQDINKMPKEIIKAFAYLKKAAAITNHEAGHSFQRKG
jgi:fumarate hydratase class II